MLLAIETSCDETAAAVLAEKDGRPQVLSSVVASQHEFHARFGGIVPEIAARCQVETLQALVADALQQAGVGFSDLQAVAVVNGPGLIGSLVVGVAAAKAIALARAIPLVGVNHLEAHIYAIFLPATIIGGSAYGREEEEPPTFPLLCLIASGGHTHLVLMAGHGQFQVVGRTRDDAAGEAFDKAGKLLGLPYPGGPALAALAESGKESRVKFPVAETGNWDFSFSGTKTALARQVRELSPEQLETQRADLAAGFQWAIVQALTKTALRAAEAYSAEVAEVPSATKAGQLGVDSLAVVGGVACNSRLRQELSRRARQMGLRLILPPPRLCTDNAAMVAAAAYHKLAAGVTAGLDLDCDSSLPLINWR